MIQPLIVIVSHARLASCLVLLAQELAGEAQGLLACELGPNETAAQLAERLRPSVQGRPTLFLVDLTGGTPHQAALMVARQATAPTHVLAGVNLAMVCEALLSRESLSLPSLIAAQALQSARRDLSSWNQHDAA